VRTREDSRGLAPERKGKERKGKEEVNPFSKCPAFAGPFERFWAAYPKRRNKDEAIQAFLKIRPDDQLMAVMLAAIERAMTRDDWRKEGGQFIPYPATWLNKGAWKDEEMFPVKRNGSGNKQEALEASNREIASRWVPPELRDSDAKH